MLQGGVDSFDLEVRKEGKSNNNYNKKDAIKVRFFSSWVAKVLVTVHTHARTHLARSIDPPVVPESCARKFGTDPLLIFLKKKSAAFEA